MEILIVDGYNIINSWPELISLTDNLELARDKLVDILLEYGAYKDIKVVIVFDAHLTKSKGQVQVLSTGLEVVYTKEKQTADSYIEKMAYCLVREKRKVYVVTSDWAEQAIILGAGAFRISGRELLSDVNKAKKEIQNNISEKRMAAGRSEVANRLQEEVFARLDAMRRANKNKKNKE